MSDKSVDEMTDEELQEMVNKVTHDYLYGDGYPYDHIDTEKQLVKHARSETGETKKTLIQLIYDKLLNTDGQTNANFQAIIYHQREAKYHSDQICKLKQTIHNRINTRIAEANDPEIEDAIQEYDNERRKLIERADFFVENYDENWDPIITPIPDLDVGHDMLYHLEEVIPVPPEEIPEETARKFGISGFRTEKFCDLPEPEPTPESEAKMAEPLSPAGQEAIRQIFNIIHNTK